MSLTESELIGQLLTAIINIVVKRKGTTVYLGDLNELVDSWTFETAEDAEYFARMARLDAIDYYKEMIYDDRENIRERLKKHNELDY